MAFLFCDRDVMYPKGESPKQERRHNHIAKLRPGIVRYGVKRGLFDPLGYYLRGVAWMSVQTAACGIEHVRWCES